MSHMAAKLGGGGANPTPRSCANFLPRASWAGSRSHQRPGKGRKGPILVRLASWRKILLHRGLAFLKEQINFGTWGTFLYLKRELLLARERAAGALERRPLEPPQTLTASSWVKTLKKSLFLFHPVPLNQGCSTTFAKKVF